jgi:hypothetical protein
MEIVFIHGLQISDYREAYWKTWVAGEKDKDGKEICWPIAWLGKDFPVARILSLSYDSSLSRITGRMDLHLLGEAAILQEMVQLADVGQHNCPVVFVCHGLGGLIAKEIVIQAQWRFGKDPHYVRFLQNIRGFRIYSTQNVSKLADLASSLPKIGKIHQPVMETEFGRLNGLFDQIVSESSAKWAFEVIAEVPETVYVSFLLLKLSARRFYGSCLQFSCWTEVIYSTAYLGT